MKSRSPLPDRRLGGSVIARIKNKNKKEAEKVKSHYNRIAEKYVKRHHGAQKRFYQEIEGQPILSFVNLEGKTVLDLGCGTGWFAYELAKVAKRVVGVDFSKEMIRVAQRENEFPNVDFFVMDAKNLGFHSASFDAVFSLGMFEYIQDLSPFLKEVWRVLKEEGCFIFTCGNENGISFFPLLQRLGRPPFETVKHSIEGLREALHKNGFKVINHTTIFHLSFFPPLPEPLLNIYGELLILTNEVLECILPENGLTLIIHTERLKP